jgi:regulator of protease activity HflC (stomatin/prohibitin superfamily)|uniref:Paraslipin n=1 Tax=candidate division WOR-3 bacterium TaxID=2052148 RepID=A0A7C6AA21_UNCW3
MAAITILAVLVILIVILIVALAIKGLVRVAQAEVIIVERLGKFHRLAESGIRIIWPLLDKKKKVYARIMKTDAEGKPFTITSLVDRIDLREQILDFPKQTVITKDNVTIDIDSVFYFRITDPVRATYEIANLPYAIEMLVQTTLRNIIGEMDLDQTLASREIINNRLRQVLDETTSNWGVTVTRVEIQNIEPPPEIKITMERQMRAERDRRAQVLEAEGKKQASILSAEGEKAAAILWAEGTKQKSILEAQGRAEALLKLTEAEAEAVEKIKAVIGEENATKYLIAIKYLQSLEKIASGPANKIFLPIEASGILGSLAGIKEIFK